MSNQWGGGGYGGPPGGAPPGQPPHPGQQPQQHQQQPHQQPQPHPQAQQPHPQQPYPQQPGQIPPPGHGVPVPGQPMPGQPMPGQPMPGQPMPGQPMPGQMPMGQQPMMPMGQQPLMPGQMPMGQQPMMGGPIQLSGASANIAANTGRSMGFVIFMVAITTLPIMGIMVFTFVDFSSVTGDGPEGGYCEAAAECCKVVSGGVADSACENFEDGMPVEGCKMAYEQYKSSAERMDKDCD